MPRKAKRQPRRSKPLSIEALRDYGELNGFSPPSAAFDPEGEWEHSYRLAVVGRLSGGFLRLKRRPSAGGGILLEVQWVVPQSAGTVSRSVASVECAGDALATPRSWRITSELLDAGGNPIESVKVSEEAVVRDGGIRVSTGKGTFVRKPPGSFTSNWSLFDAIQRLPGARTKPIEFTLLEDMDMVKEGQRLSYAGTKEFAAGGKPLRLLCYHQIGHAVLPWRYWIDERRRLLFAVSGLRAYIFDPKAGSGPGGRTGNARKGGQR